MNKYQLLTKKTMKTAIKAGALLLVMLGVYVLTTGYEDDALTKKSEAESKYSQDQSLLSRLQSQMEKSGEAEKKFIALQNGRTLEEFSANFDTFQNFLRTTKDRYHISAELKIAREIPSDKAELKNLPYDVVLRPHMEMTFTAISDVHVFSFINELKRHAPGLVRINKVEIKRVSKNIDLTDEVIANLKAGRGSLLVQGTIDFTWVRFVPKETKAATGATVPSAATP
jgi:hypothetical protein